MKKFVELFLGIMTAVGGFVEVGELVFSMNAGAKFGYSLLWVLALGTVGIIVYCEMAGRIAAVKGQPVFNLVRERAGLDAGLVVLGAQLFMPRGIEPQLPGAAALGPALLYGKTGLVVALGGMFFAFAGAAVENALSGAYNLAQFLGWPWGKFRPARKAARFTLSWMAILLLSTLVILTGVDPVSVVEYSIVFAVVLLPFTYFPVMLIAGDKDVMGEFANGPVMNALGWFYLAVVTIAALLAVPLLIITGGGQG